MSRVAGPRVANRRIRLLLASFVLLFGIAFLRAAWLQGVRAGSYGSLAASQHSEDVTLPAARGTIYDRGGLQLAIGEQTTTVYADPLQVRDPNRAGAGIAALIVSTSSPVRSNDRSLRRRTIALAIWRA